MASQGCDCFGPSREDVSVGLRHCSGSSYRSPACSCIGFLRLVRCTMVIHHPSREDQYRLVRGTESASPSPRKSDLGSARKRIVNHDLACIPVDAINVTCAGIGCGIRQVPVMPHPAPAKSPLITESARSSGSRAADAVRQHRRQPVVVFVCKEGCRQAVPSVRQYRRGVLSGCKPVNRLVSDKDDRCHLPDATRPICSASTEMYCAKGQQLFRYAPAPTHRQPSFATNVAPEAVIIQHGVEIVVLQQVRQSARIRVQPVEAERLFPDSEPCALSASCSACTVAMG